MVSFFATGCLSHGLWRFCARHPCSRTIFWSSSLFGFSLGGGCCICVLCVEFPLRVALQRAGSFRRRGDHGRLPYPYHPPEFSCTYHYCECPKKWYGLLDTG